MLHWVLLCYTVCCVLYTHPPPPHLTSPPTHLPPTSLHLIPPSHPEGVEVDTAASASCSAAGPSSPPGLVATASFPAPGGKAALTGAGDGDGEEAVAVPPGSECVVCLDQPRTALLYRCGHVAVCLDCGKKLLQDKSPCPVCRQTITDVVRAYS